MERAPMRIRLFGPRGHMGIGVHLASIKQALESFDGLPIRLEHYHDRIPEEVREAIQTSSVDDFNIFFGDVEFSRALRGTQIFWSVFETSRPPLGFDKWLQKYDWILTPSAWGEARMVEAGLPREKIHIAPEGVNPLVFYPHGRRKNGTAEPFRFLMMGKYETRKGYQQAFEAFSLAFGTNSKVELWIKPEWISESRVMMAPQCILLLQRYNLPNVRWVRGLLSMTQLRALYQQTDALLFPSLGEGWGLPLIESIACALPAVCTDYGGQSEYLSEVRQCYTPIQYNLSPVRFAPEEADLESKVDPRALWAYPRINELAAAMSSVVCESTSLRSGRALEAAEHVRRNFSWTIAADKLMKLIDQMKRQR